MKKFTLTLSIALIAVFSASAQMQSATTKSGGDSILLSKTTMGNKVVERYLVSNPQQHSVEYQIMFPLDSIRICPTFDENAQQIAALSEFAAKSKDTMMHITAVKIVGTASPDGQPSKNAILASSRAKALAMHISTICPSMNPVISSMVYKWADCVPVVANSSLEQPQSIVAILNGNHTEEQKQAALMKHPQAWAYLDEYILPPMRYAKIMIHYTMDTIVEKSIAQPQPAPKPVATPVATQPTSQTKPYPVAIVETDDTGIIVEVPQKERRHHRKNRKNR